MWQARAATHADRIDALTAGHRARRGTGERHPVQDFLFEYYNHPPSKLRRWHPGPGIALEGVTGDPRERWSGYTVDRDVQRLDLDRFVERRGRTLDFVSRLLRATLARPAHLGCFGLHEWAMVYRLAPGEQRHEQLPLRLSQADTDEVVRSHRIACSHFDAYRFFTEPAAPLNALRPTRESQAEHEQPGCLHAGMDAYKWCFKLAPAIPSELTADAFELALRIRELDMQASPYDVREFGLDAIPIETPGGKAEYLRRQRAFAEESNAVRRRLLETITTITGAGSASPGSRQRA